MLSHRILFSLIFCLFIPLSLFGEKTETYKEGGAKFEEAYKIEPTDPKKAILLYREALELGLDNKLKQAANWKLFYLYRNSQNFFEALKISSEIGTEKKLANVLNSLYPEIKRNWQINDEVLKHFLSGAEIIINPKSKSTKPSSKKEDPRDAILFHFKTSLDLMPSNKRYRDELIKILNKEGYDGIAIALLTESPEFEYRRKLLDSEQLIKANKHDEAKVLLLQIARDPYSENYSARDRSRILYLLGNIYKHKENYHLAVYCYRLSASYAENEKKSLHKKSLAAYMLYKINMPLQAMAILRNNPEIKKTRNKNIKLLYLILQLEVDGNNDAFSELKKMRPYLENRVQENHSSPLVQRALEIIKEPN